jgi:hypothetical protein
MPWDKKSEDNAVESFTDLSPLHLQSLEREEGECR